MLVVLNALSAAFVAGLYLALRQLLPSAIESAPRQDHAEGVVRALLFIGVWAVFVQIAAGWLVAVGLLDVFGLARWIGARERAHSRPGAYVAVLSAGVLAGVGAAYFLSFSGW